MTTLDATRPKPTTNYAVYLKNGQQVQVNDHVYCSPSWTIRDGTPYSVARIMEFLRPEGKKGVGSEMYEFTRVRLAWYYRPSDVSDRPVSDSRLLLAAIYSEICDINQLRAKCHVVHRDKIPDLAGWKKRPDRFYFNRLFDPYIKREFDVIQSTDVRNLPEDVRQNLIEKYEYIAAEKEFVLDLTDAIRLCHPCGKWCPSADSVRCDRCKQYFHMACVQPPLAAKPSRGYGWTCAPCAKEHEAKVEGYQVSHSGPQPYKPRTNAPALRGRGRPRKDRTQGEREENLNIKHFGMWPFRYFGQYTVATDTLDDDDLIFPRAPVRQGPKFQAVLPELNSTAADEERGSDNTVEVLSAINILTDAEVTEMETYLKTLTAECNPPKGSVDWLTEVIRRFSEAALAAKSLSTVSMESPMRSEMWKPKPVRYIDKEWTKQEIAAFEDGILTHGAELRSVREEVGTRSIAEVVRFYGLWKSSKVGEENKTLREKGEDPEPEFPKYANMADKKQTVGPSDDDASVITAPSKPPSCGACRTRDSKVWWKAPRGLPSNFLCDTCGNNWRRYADLNVRPLREESVPTVKSKSGDKREGTPLATPPPKRARTSSNVAPTPPPPSISSAPHLRCQACLKTGPAGKVLKCKKCEFRIHSGSCGASDSITDTSSWLCDICENEETLEASVIPECLLCPKARPRPTEQKNLGPIPDSYLRACKPTEGQGWVHLVCGVFTPELAFSDSTRLRLVEGVSAIHPQKWLGTCCLCLQADGAVTRCNDCNKEFHISCAWNHGYKFGFEIQPVKSSRRENIITVSFKGESGCMNAIISCKEHDHSRRDIYEICEKNESGDTALQVYCQAYKQAPTNSAHALLRKAKRLDQILGIKNDTSASGSDTHDISPRCRKCHTEFSPAFYPAEESLTWLCHRCYLDGVVPRANINGTTNGIMTVSGSNIH